MPTTIDLQFQGHARVIASAVLPLGDGIAVVDPGPASCLPALESGLAAHGWTVADIRAVLLTHIHLDHAGATGTLVARNPRIEVCVHERGAPHMIDPAKLIASASRLYGEAMDRLWGEFLPTAAANVRVLTGGEVLRWGGCALEVAYTPGHAVHHVSYLDSRDGTAYVGDTAGVRVGGDGLIAPTPPPDIDVEAWEASLDRMLAWHPVRLYLTHFGEVTAVTPHIARLRETLRTAAERVRASLDTPGDDAARAAAHQAVVRREVEAMVSATEARALELAAPFDQLWSGLARYWRKRSA